MKRTKEVADKKFALAVKTLGRCENCGSSINLTCAHIKKRRYDNTRCDFRNALCLCLSCHSYFEVNDPAFQKFLDTHYLGTFREQINSKAQEVAKIKVDWASRYVISDKIIKGQISLKQARIEGL